jgi:hypothetical protein
MLRTSLWLLALSTALTAAGASRAQTLEAIELRDAVVLEAWSKTPLTVRRAVFVSQHPQGFGQYVARSSNVFKPGEKLVAYVEPVGYGWKEKSKGNFEFGFDVDFLIKSPDGKLMGGQENFAHLAENSHAQNREFMLTLTMSLDGAPAGDYVLQYKLRDIASSKTALVTLPFKIEQ